MREKMLTYELNVCQKVLETAFQVFGKIILAEVFCQNIVSFNFFFGYRAKIFPYGCQSCNQQVQSNFLKKKIVKKLRM